METQEVDSILYYNVVQTVDAMQTTLTVRISSSEAQSLDGLCLTTGKSRSEVVRDALRGHSLRESLRQSQAQLAPLARAAGWLTEDDLLNEIA